MLARQSILRNNELGLITVSHAKLWGSTSCWVIVANEATIFRLSTISFVG